MFTSIFNRSQKMANAVKEVPAEDLGSLDKSGMNSEWTEPGSLQGAASTSEACLGQEDTGRRNYMVSASEDSWCNATH